MNRIQPRKPLWRQLLARLLQLPPIENSVAVHRNIGIPMSDGETLYADRFEALGNNNCPTILIRSPWGRGWESAPFSLLYRYVAQRFAERGYHVLLQDTHKRPWRDAHPMPQVHEVQDGQDTMKWLAHQPWFNGELGLWGASYLGYVQWATLASALPPLKKIAIVPVTTSTNWSSVMHPDGVPALDTLFRLQYLTGMPSGSFFKRIKHLRQQESVIADAVDSLPILDAARTLPTADGVNFAKALEARDTDGPFWSALDLSKSLGSIDVHAHFIAGWYDIFLREQLTDCHLLSAAGRRPALTVGPWHHTDRKLGDYVLGQSLSWFNTHLRENSQLDDNDDRPAEPPVKLFLMGRNEWREFETWPPKTTTQKLYLRGEQRLSHLPSGTEEAPDRYLYDPADPTPSIGGAVLNPTAGQHDNREVEARDDVLCYTSDLLDADWVAAGEPELVLFVKPTNRNCDFFGRVCDVFPDGRSMSVTDGYVRYDPDAAELQPDGTVKIRIMLWPTAYSFAAGHRIRLQISSGAHPRWARNLGTGDSRIGTQQMQSSPQAIYRDKNHPSLLCLPLVFRSEIG